MKLDLDQLRDLIRLLDEGNLTEMVDANGEQFTYAYDQLNRQTDANYPDVASPYLKIIHIETLYDANNNVTSLSWLTDEETRPRMNSNRHE